MAVVTRQRQSGPIGGEEPIGRSASQVEKVEFGEHLKALKLQAEPGKEVPPRTDDTLCGKDNASAGAEWRSREPDLSEWLATHIGNPDNPNSARYFARVINDAKAPVRFMKGLEEPFNGVVQAIPHAFAYATSAGGYAPNVVSKFLDRTAENLDQNYAREEQVYQTERTNAGVQPGTLDYARTAGNALSPMTVATAKVLAPAKGAPFVTKLWRSMVTGAAITGEQPVTSDEPYRDAKLKQMEFGAVVGVGVQVVGSAIGKGVQVANPWLEKQNFTRPLKAVENDVPKTARADTTKPVGNPNLAVGGRQYTDRDTGHTVNVFGNSVETYDSAGNLVSRGRTVPRIKKANIASGKWIPPGEQRQPEAARGDTTKPVGNPTLAGEGRQYTDRDTGHTVNVFGNSVKTYDSAGNLVSRGRTVPRIRKANIASGKWIPSGEQRQPEAARVDTTKPLSDANRVALKGTRYKDSVTGDMVYDDWGLVAIVNSKGDIVTRYRIDPADKIANIASGKWKRQ